MGSGDEQRHGHNTELDERHKETDEVLNYGFKPSGEVQIVPLL